MARSLPLRAVRASLVALWTSVLWPWAGGFPADSPSGAPSPSSAPPSAALDSRGLRGAGLLAQEAPRPMGVVDLLEVPDLDEPRVSPDGERLLYVLSEADWEENRKVSHIWLSRLDGEDAFRLTNGEKGESSPRWSPDGSLIAFLAARDGEGEDEEPETQVWLIRPDGGEAWRLTDHPTAVSSIAWSPDGAWIHFLAEDEETEERRAQVEAKNDVYAFDEDYRHRHLWRVAVPESGASGEAADPDADARDAGAAAEGGAGAGAEPRAAADTTAESGTGVPAVRLTEGEFSIVDYSLSRDGSAIVLRRQPTPLFEDWGAGEVWVADADGGDARRVTDNEVPEGDARLSPSGDRVLYTSMSDASGEFYYNGNLFVVPVDGGEPRLLMPDVPWEVAAAEWSADGAAIYFVANTGVRSDLFRVDAAGGEPVRLTEGDHALSDWEYRPELGLHAFTLSTPESPGDVWVLEEGAEGSSGGGSAASARGVASEADIAEGDAASSDRRAAAPRRVTAVFEDLAERFRLPRQEAVRWRGEDGTEVEGLLFYPLDYEEGRRYPLVVQTHGGPTASDKFGFGSWIDYPQVLAARGWLVLQPNYRGSTGYGDAFLRDMVGHYFRQAHLDVMTGVDHLIGRGLADGERMAKMGWSAGGHMTNKIITHTDRFRAASSGAGAANWVSMYGQSDIRFYRTPWFGATPWAEDTPFELYWEQSPLSDVHRVTTPTLFLVGEEDVRVPMPQSVEMFRALEANGVPTHLYVAPREPHGWRELRHRLFKVNVELDWFERRVRDREYDWETAPGDEAEESVDAPTDVHAGSSPPAGAAGERSAGDRSGGGRARR